MTKELELAGLSLKQLEAVVEDNLLSFVVVGTTLMHIRDSGKYAKAVNPDTGENYGTFSEYMRCRWEPSRRHLYRCITGVAIRGYLQKVSDPALLPSHLEPIQPLSKLASPKQVELDKADPEDWARGWKKAIKIAGDQEPTEKQVKQAVDEILKKRKADKLPEPEPFEGADAVLVGDATDPKWLASMPEDKFDLLLTDPPWEEKSLETYVAAGKAALKCLRPGGVLAIYFGKIFLPEVIRAVNDYLNYEWMFSIYYPGGRVRIRKAEVYDCWRPVGIFRKPGPRTPAIYEPDLIDSGGREKDAHEWQQSIGPARLFVRRYSAVGGAVLDPFVGGGTFALAAKLEGRHFLAFDKNPATVKIAIDRVTRGTA
jgi:hypothetical protein